MDWRLVAVTVTVVVVALAALQVQVGERRVVATTTTSLYATGLLDTLAQAYEEKTGVRVDFVPVGSGEALRRAEQGDACLVLVHAPSLEAQYMSRGVIEYHRIFAYNSFVIVGPPGDPAGVAGAESVVEAMKRVYEAGEEGRILWVSRGDRSGTHVREMMLWEKAGLDPRGRPWYLETGQGMMETLVIAGEKGAYTLSDIGTFLKYNSTRGHGALVIVYEGDPLLINVYSAYLVSSCQGREREWARGFIDFISGPEGQAIIGDYGVDEYGRPLFYPAQGRVDWLAQVWSQLAGVQG